MMDNDKTTIDVTGSNQTTLIAPTGWLCPACGRGNAPTTATCPCCGGWRLSIEGRRSNDIKGTWQEPTPCSPLQAYTTCPKCQHGARSISDHRDKPGWLCCDRCRHSWDADPDKVCSPVQTGETGKAPDPLVRNGLICCPKCKRALSAVSCAGATEHWLRCDTCGYKWGGDD